MLQIYNSLTRKKELFESLKPGEVNLYVCGITVYDHCHLGHARSMVCFDVIVRHLRRLNNKVTYVRNITDIDDKIIKRANHEAVTVEVITNKYIQSMHEDAEWLKIKSPDLEPKATDCMKEIIQLIQALLDKNYAYVSDNGDVCYAVERFKSYGQLAHKDLEGLLAGIRVEIVKEKHSPLDFVLWKQSKPKEPSWPSPWGMGRPGWHIECSAMAMHHLGDCFDIHGGGLDLQFPHHENEMAQSQAISNKPLANYWMHTGLLQINNEKMAKSKGNFLSIKDLANTYHPETVRYFLLSNHYRSSLNYSIENLDNAYKALSRLYQALKNTDLETVVISEWQQKFDLAMNDDFNTPKALSILFDLSRETNKSQRSDLAYTLKKLANNLGLLEDSAQDFLQYQPQTKNTIAPGAIEILIQQRLEARKAQDWAAADAIRKQLLAQGVELEDKAHQTSWRYKN